jgi:histone chaperone ASF1
MASSALINIVNVQVLDNPAAATSPFQFEITFEGIAPQVMTAELEWKVVYVGCASDKGYDQILAEFTITGISVGMNEFIMQAPAPNYDRYSIISSNLILHIHIIECVLSIT